MPEEVDWGSFWGWGEDVQNEVTYPKGVEDLIRRLRAIEIEPVAGMFYGHAGYSTTTFRNHPEWVLPGRPDTPDDRPIDFSHPEARQWLHDIFKRFADDGARYFWTDFNVVPTEGKLHDPHVVNGFESARIGMAAIREAVGPDAIIATYTSPMHCFAGQVDRVRTGLDMGGFGRMDYLRQIIRNVAGAYFYNRVLWINDADPITVDAKGDPKNLEEARMRVAFGACTGGFVTLTENSNYPPDRERLLTLALPSFGQAARPLDMMLREAPEEYHVPVHTEWGDWHVMVLQNWNEEPRHYSISRGKLRLPEDGDYVLYDFWERALLGDLGKAIEMDVKPLTCKVLLLKQRPTRPEVLSTDMHILQGAVELSDVKWDGAALSGKTSRHPGAHGRVTLYIPKGYQLSEASVPYEGAAVGKEDSLVDLVLDFGEADQAWSAVFAR